MAAEHGEPDGRTERESGPRTWLVVALTVALGGLLVGGGVVLANRLGPDEGATGRGTTVAAPGTAEAQEVGPASKLFDRTTEAGITLRVYTTDEAPGWDPGFAGDDLPDRCISAGLAQATAIGKAAVTTAQTMLTKAAPEQGNVGMSVGGVIEEDPILAFVIQTPSDVTDVGASAAGGGTDAMVPISGIAALAMRAPDDLAQMFSGLGAPANGVDPWRGILVELRHADGTSTKLTGTELQMGSPMWSDPECTQVPIDDPPSTATLPPPSLPPGTGELPPDPAAAERDIRAAMQAAYAVGASHDRARVAAIDDPGGIQFMIDRVRSLENGNEVDPKRLEITEIGFLTGVEASFFYDLVLDDGQEFLQQYGRARFVDGAWKITRATVCTDWERLGNSCGP